MTSLDEFGLLLAKVIVSEADDATSLIIGESRLWVREALEEALRTELKEKSNEPWAALQRMAAKFGVFPTDIRTSETSDLFVSSGNVYLCSALKKLIQENAEAQIRLDGYVDLNRISTAFALYGETEFVEKTLKESGVPVIKKQEYLQNLEQQTLLERLLSSDNEPIQIPVEHIPFVMEAYRNNQTLRSRGTFTSSKGLFEPNTYREQRVLEIQQKLSKGGFITVHDSKLLPSNLSNSLIELETILVTPTLLESFHALLLAEIAECGCVVVSERFEDFVPSMSDGLAAIQKIISMQHASEDIIIESVQSEEDGELFVFNHRDLELVRSSQISKQELPNVFKQNDRAIALIESMYQVQLEEASNTIGSTTNVISGTLTKSELQELFTNQLWPKYCLYYQGLGKIKRTASYSILAQLLFKYYLQEQIVACFLRLLRIDLQLAESEEIPSKEYQLAVAPLISSTFEGSKQTVQQIASQYFGLSTLDPDKKQEKNILSELKSEWTTTIRRRKEGSSLIGWLSLVKLIILHLWKIPTFIPLENDMQQAKELYVALRDNMVHLPQSIVDWTENVVFNPNNTGKEAEFLESLDETIASCTKRKMSIT